MDISTDAQNKIDLMLTAFNFKGVVASMKAMELKWEGQDGSIDFLTEDGARQCARILLEAVIKEGPDHMASTGGFTAFQDAQGDIGLEYTLDAVDTSDMEALRYRADSRRLLN